MSTRSGHGWGRRRIALAFIPLAVLLAFAPQASAQPAQSTTTAQASPAEATVGERVVLTATVTCPNSPDGGLGVTFFDGPNLLATAPVDPETGQAELATSFTTTGSHTITAAYNGNENCGASYDETTVEISDAPPPTPPSGGLISFDRFANGNTFNNIGNNY
jgi:Bacterial Ig-like domain (group 3)